MNTPIRPLNGVGPGAGLSARQQAIARAIKLAKEAKKLMKGNKKP